MTPFFSPCACGWIVGLWPAKQPREVRPDPCFTGEETEALRGWHGGSTTQRPSLNSPSDLTPAPPLTLLGPLRGQACGFGAWLQYVLLGPREGAETSADRAPATFRSAGREPRELRMGLRFPGWKVRRPQEVLSHKSVELVLRTLIPSSSSSLGATSPTSPASPRPLPGHPHPCVSSGLLVSLSRQSQPLAQWNPPWSFLKCIPEPDSESLRGGAWQPAFLPPGYSQEILIISQTWWLLPKLGSSQP